MLKSLGGRPTYVGEDVGRASLADFAFLSFYFAGIVGILHGAAFCKAADLDLDQFFGAMPSFTPGDGRAPALLSGHDFVRRL